LQWAGLRNREGLSRTDGVQRDSHEGGVFFDTHAAALRLNLVDWWGGMWRLCLDIVVRGCERPESSLHF
jgi:hypothetical protein